MNYFNLVEPYQPSQSVDGMYIYSYSLQPDKYQPSGSKSFSSNCYRKPKTPKLKNPLFTFNE